MSNKLVTAYDMIKVRDATIDELQAEVDRLCGYKQVYELAMKSNDKLRGQLFAAINRIAELELKLERATPDTEDATPSNSTG